MARKKLPRETETKVLTQSRRRCALCYALDRDVSEKRGQIAHLDRDAENDKISNLCFLCLSHHDQYDSITSQSKHFTKAEVGQYRDELYKYISSGSLLNTLSDAASEELVPEKLSEHFRDIEDDPVDDYLRFHLYCYYQEGTRPGGQKNKFHHNWTITGIDLHMSSDVATLKLRRRTEESQVFRKKIVGLLAKWNSQLIETEEGLCLVSRDETNSYIL